MLTETGKIVEVSSDSLLVQVIQQTTCGSCAAQKGCGQGVLAKYLSGSHFVRVWLRHRHSREFAVGQDIELGIEESAMLHATFLVYLLPLLAMITGAFLGSTLSEGFSIFFAILGLITGGIYVRYQSQKKKNDPRYAPVVMDDQAVLRILGAGNT